MIDKSEIPKTNLWRRPWVVAVALVIVAVIAGGLTFLAGSLQQRRAQVTVSSSLSVDAPKTPERFARRVLLRMDWGDGPKEAYRTHTRIPASTLEAVLPAEDGGFVVVDHVPAVYGARLRLFDASGDLRGVLAAPGGSTLFRPWPGGFAYVIAKTSLPSEQVILVRDGGSVVDTYTVPLQLNSGGIVRSGADIYVTVVQSTTDPVRGVTTAQEILVPVARAGRQVSDGQARTSIVEAWTIGEDGKRYARVLEQRNPPGGVAQLRQTITRLSDGASLDIPWDAIPLEVDHAGRVLVFVPPAPLPQGPAAVAGWSAVDEGLARFVAGAFDGSLKARIVVPRYGMLRNQRDGFWFSGSDLLAAAPDEKGVSIVRHRRIR